MEGEDIVCTGWQGGWANFGILDGVSQHQAAGFNAATFDRGANCPGGGTEDVWTAGWAGMDNRSGYGKLEIVIRDNDIAPAEAISTVPTVGSWSGAAGQYVLTGDSRILITGSASATTTLAGITTSVSDTAATFKSEVAAVSGLDLTVASSATPYDGDILLTLLGSRDNSIGDEGYLLEIGDRVEIEANTNTGLYYGTRTVLQLLKDANDRRTLPRGAVKDSPSLTERSVLIDAGRKYWQPEYVKDLIRQMGWLKLNRLHLHLTDWKAFRLDSDDASLEGLAALGSYDRSTIEALEAVAKRHHVVIVPEIDIPGHAKTMGDFSKDNAFQCDSMSRPAAETFWEGDSGPHWTLNYTGVSANSPASGRDFMYGLIDEFAPWFSGSYFHIGTDEVPAHHLLANCPEITHYVSDSPSVSTNGDVLVEFIDGMYDRLKTHDKRTQIWTWYAGETLTKHPAQDVLIDSWNNGEQAVVNNGHDVIKTGWGFYLVPGVSAKRSFPDYSLLYTWNKVTSPRLKGLKLSVWTDDTFAWPDYQYENLMFTSRALAAERNWHGAHANDSSLTEFIGRAESLGSAPLFAGEPAALPKGAWTIHNAPSQCYQTVSPLVESYSFSVSDDGINWIPVIENGEFPHIQTHRNARTIEFPKQTARYLRFTGLSSNDKNSNYASLAELDVFGTAVGGSPCGTPTPPHSDQVKGGHELLSRHQPRLWQRCRWRCRRGTRLLGGRERSAVVGAG